MASEAKFNTSKSEIIPLGTKTFWEKLIMERKGHQDHGRIPEHIHISGDGEPVRRAWYGNIIKAGSP